MTMTSIQIRNLSKHYSTGAHALVGVDLQVADGELLTLVGPSGSGKSTLLRLIAGLERPTQGAIQLDDVDVAGLPPHKRNVAMVFQDLALYSHLTVAGNLQFGGASDDRVAEVAQLVRIDQLLSRYPAELSGGEQQRVALGRAIVRRPKVLLLDEPLSSVDGPLRRSLRREIKALQRALQVPMIYVTHDQAEALALGDRVAVLHEGRLLNVSTPDETYERPQSRFIAEFFGPAGMNTLSGVLRTSAGNAEFEAGGWRLQVPLSRLPNVHNSARVLCGFRPSDLVVGPGELRGEVASTEMQGEETYVHVRLPGDERGAQTVIASFKGPAHARPAPGAVVSLALAGERLHWFHPDSGCRIETLN